MNHAKTECYRSTEKSKFLDAKIKKMTNKVHYQMEEKSRNSVSGSKELLRLNLRGIKFELIASLFNTKYPNSRLANLSNLALKTEPLKQENLVDVCDFYEKKSNEFYFNRDPFIFNSILDLYVQDGSKIHINEGVCFNHVLNQLKYWGFENEVDQIVDQCCLHHLNERKSEIEHELSIDQELRRSVEFQHEFKYKIFFPKLREKIFNCMEKPHPFDFSKDAFLRLVLIK